MFAKKLYPELRNEKFVVKDEWVHDDFSIEEMTFTIEVNEDGMACCTGAYDMDGEFFDPGDIVDVDSLVELYKSRR